MKTRKPRTKKQKNVHFIYDIETYGMECLEPWSYKSDGNIHTWQQLFEQILASLSEKKKQDLNE